MLGRTVIGERTTPQLGLPEIGAALAWVAAIVYVLIALDLVDVAAPPRPVMVLAAVAYLAGWVLMRRRERWLWRAGAIANVLVMVGFVISLAAGNAEIEPMSVISKIAQVGLEVVLVVLVWRSPAATNA
jgi:hypothetical protein